eukprot:CAMPEP_0195030748 /NCGR_PEP_ID=MMETSP0326_2-20130528/59657_1 /TAXON_ID=2866 ORGANISM="Crypthecodinium cohnii, Strain Seligo" /NCGR_SAMPLE_ID=MMETSP0326_2 /ASSEMBLY_ACC=CAM_ASM_000348 /LENGTH=61 /DNA_ID=CAMNT_0040054171 /DNA_START=283 /DNA_END=468 /DNA_ORIENTATION=+
MSKQVATIAIKTARVPANQNLNSGSFRVKGLNSPSRIGSPGSSDVSGSTAGERKLINKFNR